MGILWQLYMHSYAINRHSACWSFFYGLEGGQNEKPIIALDFESINETGEFLSLFFEEKLNLKIGLELFYNVGPEYVHASGGVEMMQIAKEGLLQGTELGQKVPLLITVTQLTSREDETNQYEQQLAVPQDESILHLAKFFLKNRLDGVIWSPLKKNYVSHLTS